MNRALLIIIVLIGFRYIGYGQRFESISANNINASYEAGGLFFAADTGHYGFNGGLYEVPKGSGLSTILSSAPVLTALDSGNNTRGGFNYYGANQNLRFGPVAHSDLTQYDSAYNKVFKATHAEILSHITHHNDVGYVIPRDIAQWPGNGNVSNGEPAILAPFVDLNGNQIYEPAIGEYPDIYGDDAVFMMLNDSLGSPYYYCNRMYSEIHVMAYSFQVPPDSILYNTTFMRFTIFNRSTQDYHDVKFSSFIDADLGCAENDRIGCDTSLNSFFTYNDPNIPDQGNVCYAHTRGYGLQKIVQGATFLNHKLTSFGSASNAGAIEMTPNCPIIRNWQTGKWADGTHLTCNGNGYANSTILIDFIYPGDPTDSTQWSEIHPQISSVINAGNRKMFGTISIDSLRSGDSQVIDMALVNSFADSTAAPLAEIIKLKQDIRAVQRLYDQGLTFHSTSATSAINEVLENELTIYPNPASATLFLSRIEKDAHYAICDVTGRVYSALMTGRQIDISSLSAGIYVLHISDRSGSFAYRFIKQ